MNNNSNINILNEFKTVFEAGKYEDALTLLHQNKLKFEPGVYEYNIGLIYYKQEHYTLARINFEKSKDLGFMSTDLEIALNQVKTHLDVMVLEESSSTSDQVNEVLYDTPREFFFSITVLLLIIFIFIYKKLELIPVRIISLIVAIFPTIFFLLVLNGKTEVIFLEDQVVRRGPSTMFEEVQLAPKGMKVYIDKNIDGWNLIVHPKSHQGWIKTNAMETI